MDSDIIPETRNKTRQLILLPDADISEPATKSESDNEPIQRSKSDDFSLDSSEEDDDLPLSNLVVQQNKRWTRILPDSPDTQFCGEVEVAPKVLSPIDYFFTFFSLQLLSYITEQTVLYANQKGGQVAFSDSDISKFLGVLFSMAMIHVPQVRMYWAHSTRIPKVADVMTRDQFWSIFSNIYFNDNTFLIIDQNNPGHDRLYKIRPFLEFLRQKCLQSKNEEQQSIDEIIIPFKGKSKLKQYLPCKPNKWGFKMLARCGVSGLVYDFSLYEGKDPILTENVDEILPYQGAKFVALLCETLPKNVSHKVYFDNFFNFLELQKYLSKIGIWSVGTIRANRLRGLPLLKDKDLRTRGRGSYDSIFDKENGTYIVKWFDNKPIVLTSTFVGPKPETIVKRWDKKEHKSIDVVCPNIITTYNQHMGGVDLFDMFSALYRIDHKGRKWYRRIFLWGLSLCAINGWILYKRHCEIASFSYREVMPLLEFIDQIANSLIHYNTIPPQISAKRGRPSIVNSLDENFQFVSDNSSIRKNLYAQPLVNDACRFDNVGHFPTVSEHRQRCKLCQTQSTIICIKCSNYLCLTKQRNCFIIFHTQH